MSAGHRHFIPLLRWCKGCLAFACGPEYEPSGWSVSLGFGVLKRKEVWCIQGGFGWDADYPIRPWPKWGKEERKLGRTIWTFAFAGLFVNVACGPMQPVDTNPNDAR